MTIGIFAETPQSKTPCLQNTMNPTKIQEHQKRLPWTRSRGVILVRTAAEILRRLYRIPIRDTTAHLPIVHIVADWHVDDAADGLRGIDCKVPVRKRSAGRSAYRAIVTCGGGSGCRSGAARAGEVWGV